MPVYLTLQPIRCAACHVAVAPGELLPHLFTLASAGRAKAVVFCHIVSTVADSCRLDSMVLCVARTFLTPFTRRRATDSPAMLISNFCEFLIVLFFNACVSSEDSALG